MCIYVADNCTGELAKDWLTAFTNSTRQSTIPKASSWFDDEGMNNLPPQGSVAFANGDSVGRQGWGPGSVWSNIEDLGI